MNKQSQQTQAVRAAIASDIQHGAVVPPIYLSSNFTFDGFRGKREYDYTRSGNPTRDQLADALTQLEGGAGASITSSGMSAITLVLQRLQPGDHLIAPHDCYGGTYRLLNALSARGAFEVSFVNQTHEDDLRAAMKPSTKMVWVETPSNPLLRITDIAKTVELARTVDALVVVDNTFLSPVWQRPIALGADLVVHSTTKYLNGHSDVVGGAVVAKTEQLHQEISWWANCLGVTGAPFDSFLSLRGLRTLHARMRAHAENAQAVVDLLAQHACVNRVYHPSLPSHPGHEIAAQQQTGFGAMISFELDGDEAAVVRFLEHLSCFTLAESLGGVESLIAHPASMTHASMDPDARTRAGISESLLRLSVGIEHADDLVADLENALNASKPRYVRPRVVG
ncbi:MAG: cystathionine gamma-synthase [Myxococcota bacterium]|nr:cystathionine gamma-synthase [Myxococcota bacterium]